MRVDRWLWCIRIFKTRSAATAACRNDTVSVGGTTVKPSRELRVGESVVVQQGLVRRELKVLAAPQSRLGAKRVPEFAVDLTPASEWEKAKQAPLQQVLARARGTGRPTKRERREIDRFLDADGD